MAFIMPLTHYKVCSLLTSRRDVVAVQDPEAVDAGRVPDRVQLAVVSNVLVFSDSLIVAPVN